VPPEVTTTASPSTPGKPAKMGPIRVRYARSVARDMATARTFPPAQVTTFRPRNSAYKTPKTKISPPEKRSIFVIIISLSSALPVVDGIPSLECTMVKQFQKSSMRSRSQSTWNDSRQSLRHRLSKAKSLHPAHSEQRWCILDGLHLTGRNGFLDTVIVSRQEALHNKL
jgi:hypothetical protein